MSGNEKLEIYHHYRLSTFKALIEKNFDLDIIKVIDFGCGDGSLSKLFKGSYTGIDPSSEMIRIAKETYPNKEFINGGLDDLDRECQNSTVDLIICLNTLPYMDEKQVDRFFSIVTKSKTNVVISHTNELLDLSSCNRYTIEHRESLLNNHSKISETLINFKALYLNSDIPKPISQVEKRFGTTEINTSERDSVKKYRVDPFTWPDEISKKYNLKRSKLYPIRIFALPPSIMESDVNSFKLLHSDYFDDLPQTYKLLFCSQFRVIYKPN